MTDFPYNPQHIYNQGAGKGLFGQTITEPSRSPAKTIEKIFPPHQDPDPPKKAFLGPCMPPEGDPVGTHTGNHPEAVTGLETLLDDKFQLPPLMPFAGITIDPTLSTSLVPLETPVKTEDQSVLSFAKTVSHILEKTFRHGFWERRRQATFEALQNIHDDNETIQRFGECGSKSWIMRNVEDPTLFRLKLNKCKNRWCEACNVEKRRTVRRNLQEQLPAGNLRMLTFTLKHRDGPLKDQIDRIYDCFRKWRNHRNFRKKIRGGIFFLEVTYNHEKQQWHPHLHCLVDSEFLVQLIMRQTWKLITEDSYIVDVRKITDTASAAGEVCKYATKVVSRSIWRFPKLLTEAMESLRGRRTFQGFGKWSKMSLSRVPEDEGEWEEIGTLSWFIQQAQNGNPKANEILNAICGNQLHEPIPSDPDPP